MYLHLLLYELLLTQLVVVQLCSFSHSNCGNHPLRHTLHVHGTLSVANNEFK